MQKETILWKRSMIDLSRKSLSVFPVVFFIAATFLMNNALATSNDNATTSESNLICMNPVTADAGPAVDSICLGQTIQLNGSAGGDYTSVTWTTTGDGTFFPNAFALNAVYHPGTTDLLSMAFTLTLTAHADSPCIPASDDMEILLLELPVNVTTSNSPVCEGTALDMGAGGGTSFFWTGPNGYKGYSLDTTIYPVAMNQSGTYYVIITNDEGCSKLDSVVAVVTPVSGSTGAPIVACDSATLPWGEIVTVTDTYSKIYTAFNSCDSTVTIHVTINYSNSGDTTAFACNSFVWYGDVYSSSTIATHTLTNSSGCDSVVTLHLSVGYSNTGDTTAFANDQFEWYGITYYSSTLATHTFTNASGCDSVVTLHLTVCQSTYGDTTASFCGHFTWYGTEYSTSGDKIHVIQGGNSHGCDSVVTLHLTITPTDDGNACTTDVCNTITGATTHDANADINDGNACTTDVCNTLTGATTHNANSDINDGNACTTDVCNTLNGSTTHDDNSDINDGNACTTDVCNTLTGTTTHNANSDINDGNACTNDVCNTLTGTTTYNDITVNDGIACTIDICDSNTGITSHNTYSLSVTATSGGILCYGGTTCVTATSMGGTGAITYSDGMSSNATGIFCNYSAGGPYNFSAQDANGCSTASNPVVISQPGKLEIDSIRSTPAGCISNAGTAIVYPSGGTGAYSFLWSPGGQTSNPATGLSAGSYCVIVKDANNCQSLNTCVIVGSGGSTLPAPEPVSGPLVVCAPQSGVVYSVPVMAGAISYTWTVPANATITSGQGTRTITVNFLSTFSGGFITVRDSNACGSSPATAINIASMTNKPGKPAITGPGIVCKPSTVILCATSANATSFNWTVNHGLTILSGTGTSCITVNVPSNYDGAGDVRVRGANCKGTSSDEAKLKLMVSKPPTPTITGPAVVCSGSMVTYCALTESATSFIWTVDHGLIILSGTGTSCISVQIPSNYDGAGQVKVKGVNCNGSGSEKYLNVKVASNSLVTPSTACVDCDNGDDNRLSVCTGTKNEYEIAPIAGATCYTWTAPPGATIKAKGGSVISNPLTMYQSGGNEVEVEVIFPIGFTSGNVTVQACNPCTSSGIATWAVTGRVCRTASEELEAASLINAYPNPTTGKLNVTFNASSMEKYTLKVVDLLGNILINEMNTAQEGINLHELDLSNLAKGMYLISIERDAVQTQPMRIIVK